MDIHTVTSSLTPPASDDLVLGTSGLGAEGSDPDAVAATASALLASGFAVDTSNNYAGGRSELALGRALAALSGAEREAAASRLLTKVDRDPVSGVFDADRVRRSFDETATRLGVDHLPLLHLHDPYTVTVAEALGRGGAVEGLLRLKEEGLVSTIGVAAGPAPLLRRYIDSAAFDAVLCHNRFTLVDHSAADLFAAAKERGMTVFNAAPFGGDLLVRGPRPEARYEYRPISDDLRVWTEALVRVCADHDVPLAAVALRFSTRSQAVDRTVVGVSSPERLRALIALHETSIPPAVWDAIDALGPAPTPVHDARNPEPAKPHAENGDDA